MRCPSRFELVARGQASCDELHSSERFTSRLVAIDSNISSSSSSDVAVMGLGQDDFLGGDGVWNLMEFDGN